MKVDSEQCPWCGSQIERGKFNEIETRIRNEEQQRLKEAEQNLEKRFALEKLNIEKRFQTEANEKNAALTRENLAHQATITQLKVSQAEAIKQAENQAQQKAKENFDREIQFQRATLEKDLSHQLLKLQEKSFQEREEFQKKITDLSNQLQKKNEQEPEVTTINLCEELGLAYEDDDVSEINGKIIHKVFYKGVGCGVIIIDAKPRQSWKKDFAVNLRKEQIDSKIDHAILATTVFPKGKKELCTEENVVVAHPNCVVHLVDLLRKTMIKMTQQGLTAVDRTSKINRLYDFILSPSYTQKRQEASSLTKEVLELDVLEMEQHKKIWKKRGTIATQLQKTLTDVDLEISSILEENHQNKNRVQTTAIQGQPFLRKAQ